jgi:hypothetical protein
MVEAQTREDYVYLAKLAEQAERYEGEKPVKHPVSSTFTYWTCISFGINELNSYMMLV